MVKMLKNCLSDESPEKMSFKSEIQGGNKG